MNIMKSKELSRASQRWIDHTTLHGITYIYDSSSLFVKFIWTIVFCGFFAFACWLLSSSFYTFLNYETDTSVSRIKVSEITFPAVTVCNLYYSTDINEKNYSAEVKQQINDLNRPLHMKNSILQDNVTFFTFEYTGGRIYKSILGQEKIGFDWKGVKGLSCFCTRMGQRRTFLVAFWCQSALKQTWRFLRQITDS